MPFTPISKIEYEAAVSGVNPTFRFLHGNFEVHFVVVNPELCLILNRVSDHTGTIEEYYITYGIDKHAALTWLQTRQDDYYKALMEQVEAGRKDNGSDALYTADKQTKPKGEAD